MIIINAVKKYRNIIKLLFSLNLFQNIFLNIIREPKVIITWINHINMIVYMLCESLYPEIKNKRTRIKTGNTYLFLITYINS